MKAKITLDAAVAIKESMTENGHTNEEIKQFLEMNFQSVGKGLKDYGPGTLLVGLMIAGWFAIRKLQNDENAQIERIEKLLGKTAALEYKLAINDYEKEYDKGFFGNAGRMKKASEILADYNTKADETEGISTSDRSWWKRARGY